MDTDGVAGEALAGEDADTNGNGDGTGEQGGAILMKYGYAKREEGDHSAVWLGVCKSLQFAHKANVLHCDIRRSNVLYFKGISWRLVDFGLSCLADDLERYDLEAESGAQAEGVGPRVKVCLEKGQPFNWTFDVDYEMLVQMFHVFDNTTL